MEFREKALEVLQAQRAQSNFGNAGSAELVIKGAILKAANRDATVKELVLDTCDIDDPGAARAEKLVNPLSSLDKLFKMDKVKTKLDKMRKTWAVAKQDGDDRPNLGHFVFTGKTTVAMTIANVLFSLGLLPSNKIHETSAIDLTAGYVGQTKDKLNAALNEAKGGVLFIDEAYNLGKRPFGQEACDTIVAAMTSETFRDVVIVIAGYPYEIHEMLKSNAGLKSRFNHFFEFPDWDSSDCVSFLTMLAQREKFEIEDLAFDHFAAGCDELSRLDGWGNGRDVTKLWEMSKSNRGERAFDSGEDNRIISVDDIVGSISEMLDARQPRQSKNIVKVGDMEHNFPMAMDFKSLDVSRTSIDRDVEHVSSLTEDLDPDVDDEERHMEEVEQEHRKVMVEQDRERADHNLLEEHQEKIRLETELNEQRLMLEAIEAKRELERKEEMEQLTRELELERQKTMERLRIIGPCPANYAWNKVEGGWRCSGGSHFVTDAELHRRFGFDA